MIRTPISGEALDNAVVEVDNAYKTILGRGIDPQGASRYRSLIAERRLTVDDLPDLLRASPEYLLSRSGFYNRLHASRSRWCSDLPPWETILDIGGSSPTHELGALLELGYSHRPTELHILDLPEDDQFHGRPEYDQRVVRRRDWGTVTFHHGDAGRLEEVPELGGRQFKAVFMGQVIEHIPPDELPGMLAQIRSHLTDDGEFVFDTPNRSLTRIVMGDALLTDDHTYEYVPAEMAAILAEHGFAIEKIIGIHPMPATLSSGIFDPYETTDAAVDQNADECFCFAVHCRTIGP